MIVCISHSVFYLMKKVFQMVIDPASNAVTVVLLVFIVWSIAVSPSTSAPTTSTTTYLQDDWWNYPCEGKYPKICSKSNSTIPTSKQAINVVHIQITSAYSKKLIEVDKKGKIYFDVRRFSKKHYNLNWLPEPLLKEFEAEEKSGKEVDIAKWLNRIHKEIRQFALVFHKLSSVRVLSESNCVKKVKERDQFIKSTIDLMRITICELEKALNESCYREQDKIGLDFLIKNNYQFKEIQDCTGVLIQDWGVVSRYREVLKDWRIIAKRIPKHNKQRHSKSENKKRKSKNNKLKNHKNKQQNKFKKVS